MNVQLPSQASDRRLVWARRTAECRECGLSISQTINEDNISFAQPMAISLYDRTHIAITSLPNLRVVVLPE